jgi:DNA repair exonuclease SbcCD nuclease subunit
MKIALVTDTHWGVRNDSAVFADYFQKFYQNIFFPYLDENEITHVIHLGDIVERRKYINFYSADRLHTDFIAELKKRNIYTFFIIGNHDSYYKNTLEINSMKQLYGDGRTPKNQYIIDHPTTITFAGCDILLMPWMCQDNMEACINEIKVTNAQVVMGHLELAGFEMYKGNVIDHGMDTSIFEKFDVVCSGHYHHRSSRGNIHYLGCPYEITWSDYGDQKGFHIFDTETRELTFIPNPYKMFHKIHYNDTNWTSMDDINAIELDGVTGSYIKIIVHNKTNPYWFDMFMDRLEKLEPFGIQVVDDNLYLNLEDDEDIVSEAEDTLTILKKFVDTIDVSIDKKDIDKFLSELYSEACSV